LENTPPRQKKKILTHVTRGKNIKRGKRNGENVNQKGKKEERQREN
jgi:hypothetical protein